MASLSGTGGSPHWSMAKATLRRVVEERPGAGLLAQPGQRPTLAGAKELRAVESGHGAGIGS